MTTRVEKSIQVDQPINVVYNQWTQFEEFPKFMSGVQSVTQLDDRRLHWVAEIAGVRREWDATILEQVPDQKIAWAATEGATNAGAVYFATSGAGRTEVRLSLEYAPEGIVEKIGDKLHLIERQAESDLERFKAFIEEERSATGAWRGAVLGDGTLGTPDVDDAEASKGTSGKAGLSAAAKVVGAAAAAVGVAAAAGAMKSSGASDATESVDLDAPPSSTPPVEPAAYAPELDEDLAVGSPGTFVAPVDADAMVFEGAADDQLDAPPIVTGDPLIDRSNGLDR